MYQLTWRLAGFVLQLDAKIPGFSGKAQARAWFQAEFSWKKPRLVLLGLPASDLARLNEKLWEGMRRLKLTNEPLLHHLQPKRQMKSQTHWTNKLHFANIFAQRWFSGE
jgi:hypothetical protein